jgi:hypothetical protein
MLKRNNVMVERNTIKGDVVDLLHHLKISIANKYLFIFAPWRGKN